MSKGYTKTNIDTGHRIWPVMTIVVFENGTIHITQPKHGDDPDRVILDISAVPKLIQALPKPAPSGADAEGARE